MKRVVQEKDNDCGFACVAMLYQKHAGIPADKAYDAARKAISEEAARLKLNRTKGRTGTRHLIPALLRHGIPVSGKMIPLRGKTLDEVMNGDALLKGKITIEGVEYTHWCVWDSVKKRVLDPWHDRSCTTRITSYMRVGNPD